MGIIPASLQQLVVRRANNLCEYCRISQEGQEARFHIDHGTIPTIPGTPYLIPGSLFCLSLFHGRLADFLDGFIQPYDQLLLFF
jgi:hypothetical protein